MTLNYNSVKIEGNENVVLQSTDGDTLVETLQIFIGRFTKDKDERILLLEKILYDKEKIEAFSQDKINNLSEELKRLLGEKANLEKQVNKMLEDFSQKDISKTDSIYQEAFKLFIGAKLDEALEVLNEIRLQDELKKIEQQEQEALKERTNLADNYIFKAQILRLKFAFVEAESCFEKAVTICNETGYHNEAGKFFRFLNELDKAEVSFQKALKLAKTKREYALTLNNHANLQLVKKDFNGAEESFGKALAIYKKLSEPHSPIFLSNLSTMLNNLAIAQRNRGEFSESGKNYNEALKIRRELAKTQPDLYLPKVATTLNNLAVLQSVKKEFNKAEGNYNEALSIYQTLAESKPQLFLLHVAGTLNNIANVQMEKNDFDNADKNYHNALTIYRTLAETNPKTFLPEIAPTLINIGNLYMQHKSNKTMSLLLANEAVDIANEFLSKLPAAKGWLEIANNIIQFWHKKSN